MRLVRWITGLVVAGSLLAGTGAAAHDEADLVITGAWARATQAAALVMTPEATPESTPEATAEAVPMIDISAAYFTVENAGGHAVQLIAASSPAAGMVQIHAAQMDGDIMRMRELTDGIVIDAGSSAVLEPGGLHVMLMELIAPLVEGAAIPLTLTFAMLDDAGNADGEPLLITIGVPVLAAAPEPLTDADFAVVGGWARATGDTGADVSAAYLTIRNRGAADDTLIAASSPAAGTVEIHESQMDGDIMRMRELTDGITIPAGGEAVLEPGGLHIMLLELTAPLTLETAIPLTLTFASGAEITIALPVSDPMGAAMMGMDH